MLPPLMKTPLFFCGQDGHHNSYPLRQKIYNNLEFKISKSYWYEVLNGVNILGFRDENDSVGVIVGNYSSCLEESENGSTNIFLNDFPICLEGNTPKSIRAQSIILVQTKNLFPNFLLGRDHSEQFIQVGVHKLSNNFLKNIGALTVICKTKDVRKVVDNTISCLIRILNDKHAIS